MKSEVNLFEIYTPKELTDKTVRDIKQRRYMREYEKRRRQNDVDTFLRERAWAHKKISRVR
jgi:hypothetical protein